MNFKFIKLLIINILVKYRFFEIIQFESRPIRNKKSQSNLRLFLFSAHFFSQNYSVNSFFKFKMGVLK